MNSHNSHMTANFIAYCMKHAIDLFILFLHTSHLLQPLNVNMFVPLKHTLTEETNAIFRHDSGCISQVDWISMFICIKSKVLISKDIFVE